MVTVIESNKGKEINILYMKIKELELRIQKLESINMTQQLLAPFINKLTEGLITPEIKEKFKQDFLKNLGKKPDKKDSPYI